MVAPKTGGLFVNDERTFRRLFEIAGEKLGLNCKVSVEFTLISDHRNLFLEQDPEYRLLLFSVQI